MDIDWSSYEEFLIPKEIKEIGIKKGKLACFGQSSTISDEVIIFVMRYYDQKGKYMPNSKRLDYKDLVNETLRLPELFLFQIMYP